MKKSIMLSPFAMLYGAIVGTRRNLYRKGVFKSYSLQVPTISIGNITAGGTGKTPLVAFVAKILAEQGEKICVLTRGYKRENESKRVLVSDGTKILANVKQSGDEAFELAQKLLGISAVVADANRVSAGIWARENLGATAFVLDDAFQHFKVKRDLDIVLLDAMNPFGNQKLLPQGVLREPVRNLQRADAIIITRANLVDERRIEDLKFEISKFNQTSEIFVSENKTARLIPLEEFHAEAQSTQNLKENKKLITHHSSLTTYFAFCGLGNPRNFFEQLRQEGFNLIATKSFPDHHFYTQKDIQGLEKEAKEKGANALLTTAKDAVKFKDLKFDAPCFVAESKMIFDKEEKFRKMIVEAVGKFRPA